VEWVAEQLASEVSVQVVTFPMTEGNWGLIVRAATTSKATALQWIATQHGCAMEEVVTIGDWINDIPMFRAAGRSFAMGQAPDHVKDAATDVLVADSRTGGGIAEAAERCGLL
jgi:hydroxymethylpyrimidine pyrophosphatase-like HAD family hydrolase